MHQVFYKLKVTSTHSPRIAHKKDLPSRPNWGCWEGAIPMGL